MRPVRLLVIAPRPYEDELLSCWLWRVASHYSSSPRQIENWICGVSGVSKPHLLSDDIPTEQSATRLWALACRLKQTDVERLSLHNTGRSRASFVSDPANRGVCPACLDEDAEQKRDHYCRRSWACVEAVVCPRHKTGLEINCGGCFRGGLFQFRSTPAGAVRLFCRECHAIISARRFQRRDQTDLLEVASFIGETIGKGGSEFERIGTASRFLWSPRPEGMPYIAALGLALPYGQRPSVTAGAAPLANLPPAWRAVTITAIADLLFEETAKKPLISASFREAFRRFERGPVPAYHPAPAQRLAASVLNLRAETEYRQLARGIVESEGWKSLPSKAGRARNRAIGRLMLRALNDE
ncbi:MAG: TniQ family protein [Allorhizobium sp.]